MKTYFLFGKDAVNLYHWGEFTTRQKAKMLLDEYTYDPWDVYCFDQYDGSPKHMLDFYTGYTDFCVITEEFYNLLK